MKYKFFTAIAATAMAIWSCTTDTDTLGSSLTNNSDKLIVDTGTFKAYTRSFLVDSVYARNYDTYFGRVKDPETGTYVKTEFMAQFNLQEGLTLPSRSNIVSKDSAGNIVADSCEIWMVFDKSACYGDSLTALKMNVLELHKPMSETVTYYSNYDPREKGYLREGGLKKPFVLSLSNLTYSDSIRKLTGYTDIARISLSDEYTDKEGNTYNNYGTYILRNYYDHPEYFKNSYTFINKLCPGFFFELSDGLGMMAKFSAIEMRIFYRFLKDDKTYVSYLATSSTPEVLQTTQVSNDKSALTRLAEEQNCTYLKAPAGIFTEVTLPIDEIAESHVNDSLLSVNMTFLRQNSDVTDSQYLMDAPSNVMLMPTDSLKTFFEKEKSYDYKSTYIAPLAITNSYTFNNIGNLITLMRENKKKGLAADPDWLSKHPNWNKVLLLPISISKASSTSSVSIVENQMGLVSTKLKGGADTPIDVKVVFARYNNTY